jgi:TolB protein
MLRNFSRRDFLASSAALAALSASCARAAQPDNGGLVVDVAAGERPLTVSVTAGTPALAGLAQAAFNAHGRYRLVTSGAEFDLRFSAGGANQVRVEARKAGALVLNETASGTNSNQALLRAADLVVKATSKLPGFFASKLAFVRTLAKPAGRDPQEEIYTSDLFFTETFSITQDRAPAYGPRWSPDGSRLIYTSYKKGFSDILVLNLTAQRIENFFVDRKGTSVGACYSPDGRQVAMVLSGEGQQEVYVGDAAGRTDPVRRTRSDTVKSRPCWSPDGSRILFAQTVGTAPQLYLMPAGSGEPQRLVAGFNYAAEPDWSRADPDKIAFTVGQGRGFQVAVLSLSGRFPAKVVTPKGLPAAYDMQEPTWLADGRHLVCTAKAAGVRILYLLDTETGKATRLSPTTLGECAQASVWGP